jgi:hypothetical protein
MIMLCGWSNASSIKARMAGLSPYCPKIKRFNSQQMRKPDPFQVLFALVAVALQLFPIHELHYASSRESSACYERPSGRCALNLIDAVDFPLDAH